MVIIPADNQMSIQSILQIQEPDQIDLQGNQRSTNYKTLYIHLNYGRQKSEVWDPTTISLICGLLSTRFILISVIYHINLSSSQFSTPNIYSVTMEETFATAVIGLNIGRIWWFFVHHQIAKLKSSPIFTTTELAKSLHKHMNTYHSKAHSMHCCRGQVLVILGPGHSQCVLASVLLAPSSRVIDDRIHISSDLGGYMPLQPLLSLSQPCASNLCWFKDSTHRNWELS